MGVALNDSVCRDAARAASLGPPDAINSGEPQRRAEAVVQKANKTTGAIRLDPNVTIKETLTGALPQAPYGGPVNGDVAVTTKVAVYPPFLLAACLNSPGGAVTFTARQTFNYTWSMASTAQMQAPTPGNNAAKTF